MVAFVGVECLTSLQHASKAFPRDVGIVLQTSSLPSVDVDTVSKACLHEADARLDVSSLKTLL